jgi:natural product precursor
MKKVKLNALSMQYLKNKEMNALRGGGDRCCSCVGSSTSSDNRSANYNIGDYGGHSIDGCNNFVVCEDQEPKYISFGGGR